MANEVLTQKMADLISTLNKEIDDDSKLITPRPPGPKPSSGDPIIFSDELRYLNSSWNNWTENSNFSSHRPFVGKILGKLKFKLQSYLFNVIFKDYFDRERAFTMHLVQYCNLTARYIDNQNEQLFWKLVEKVDREMGQANLRNDILFSEILKNKVLGDSAK